jgi:hypothetical protein
MVSTVAPAPSWLAVEMAVPGTGIPGRQIGFAYRRGACWTTVQVDAASRSGTAHLVDGTIFDWAYHTTTTAGALFTGFTVGRDTFTVSPDRVRSAVSAGRARDLFAAALPAAVLLDLDRYEIGSREVDLISDWVTFDADQRGRLWAAGTVRCVLQPSGALAVDVPASLAALLLDRCP